MKTYTFENEEQWLAARLMKITGTRLEDISPKVRGEGKKIGHYELIAERICTQPDGELPMARGHRLESEALALFTAKTGKEVDGSLVLWTRDDNENIASSPDGVIGKTEAVEVKCLASARHVEAYLTQTIPKDYILQGYQYFIVNEDLETLHFAFYEPRCIIEKVAFFTLELKRADIAEEIEKYLTIERTVLAEVDAIVAELSF